MPICCRIGVLSKSDVTEGERMEGTDKEPTFDNLLRPYPEGQWTHRSTCSRCGLDPFADLLREHSRLLWQQPVCQPSSVLFLWPLSKWSGLPNINQLAPALWMRKIIGKHDNRVCWQRIGNHVAESQENWKRGKRERGQSGIPFPIAVRCGGPPFPLPLPSGPCRWCMIVQLAQILNRQRGYQEMEMWWIGWARVS